MPDGNLCGACRGGGLKPGRWMGCGDAPCPMCGGRGRGGRAAGVPPERYMDWILGKWRGPAADGGPEGNAMGDGLDGARRRRDDGLRRAFGGAGAPNPEAPASRSMRLYVDSSPASGELLAELGRLGELARVDVVRVPDEEVPMQRVILPCLLAGGEFVGPARVVRHLREARPAAGRAEGAGRGAI